jgi:hypothetical protein
MFRAALLLSAALASGCGRTTVTLSEAQRSAAYDAIMALDRLQVELHSDRPFEGYAQRLAEAKAAVSEAERLLPPGDLRQSLSEAVSVYDDYGTVWAGRDELDDFDGGEIIDRYGLATREVGGRRVVDIGRVLTAIGGEASYKNWMARYQFERELKGKPAGH